MGDQERNRRLMHEIIGHAAQQPFAQTRVTITSHDDEIGMLSLRLRDQLGSDVTIAALGPMQGGVDPMMLEMIDRLGTLHSLMLGRGLVGDYDDDHLLRLVQIRHGLGQRASGFPAAVPGNEDAIEIGTVAFLFWNQKEMPPESEENALDQPIRV